MEKLTPELLVRAYANGYFPMADGKTGEVSWYRPDPRAILPLDQFHVSQSLKKTLRKGTFRATFDEDFLGVMRSCANREETWISEDFYRVYGALHQAELAHSVEIWREKERVGGAYGVSLGGAFFAESMYHTETDASKVALYYLVERLKERGFQLLEVQFLTEHLKSLGAVEIAAEEYEKRLVTALEAPVSFAESLSP